MSGNCKDVESVMSNFTAYYQFNPRIIARFNWRDKHSNDFWLDDIPYLGDMVEMRKRLSCKPFSTATD